MKKTKKSPIISQHVLRRTDSETFVKDVLFKERKLFFVMHFSLYLFKQKIFFG